jgi:hypothetical protein
MAVRLPCDIATVRSRTCYSGNKPIHYFLLYALLERSKRGAKVLSPGNGCQTLVFQRSVDKGANTNTRMLPPDIAPGDNTSEHQNDPTFSQGG